MLYSKNKKSPGLAELQITKNFVELKNSYIFRLYYVLHKLPILPNLIKFQ